MDEGSRYFYELIRLVVDLGTETLLKILQKEVPCSQTLDKFIKNNQSIIRSLEKREHLNVMQMTVLNATTIDSTKLDISLLFTLIRNLTNVQPPTAGWDAKTIPKSEVSAGAFLVRLKNVRNEAIAHKAKASLTKSEFDVLWKETEQCLIGLAKEISPEVELQVSEKIGELKVKSVDLDDKFKVDKLLKWYFEENSAKMEEMATQMKDINSKIDKQPDVSSELREVKNTLDLMQKEVKSWSLQQSMSSSLPSFPSQTKTGNSSFEKIPDPSNIITELREQNKMLKDANQKWSQEWDKLQEHYESRISDLQTERDRNAKEKMEMKIKEEAKEREITMDAKKRAGGEETKTGNSSFEKIPDPSNIITELREQNKMLKDANQKWSQEWDKLQEHYESRISDLQTERDRNAKEKMEMKIKEEAKEREITMDAKKRAGGEEVCEYLLGSSIEQTDKHIDRTPLMIAAYKGHIGVLEMLFSRGASIHKTDNEGLKALCLGYLRITQLLLDMGSNRHLTERCGRSPIQLAAFNRDAQMVQFLIDQGAQKEHADLNGMRALDCAIDGQNTEVVMSFLCKGAKLGQVTWAFASGKPDVMLLLLNKLLEDGNVLYKKNRIKKAARRYQFALKKFPTEEYGKDDKRYKELKLNLCLNLSRCNRKLNVKNCEGAVDLASKVLELKAECFEAFYARARVTRDTRQYSSAFEDLPEARNIAPTNRELQPLLMHVRDGCQEQSRFENGTGMVDGDPANRNSKVTAL